MHRRKGSNPGKAGGPEGGMRGKAQPGGNIVGLVRRDAAPDCPRTASAREEGGSREEAAGRGGEITDKLPDKEGSRPDILTEEVPVGATGVGHLEEGREGEASPGEHSIEKRSDEEGSGDEEESTRGGQLSRIARVEVAGGDGGQDARVGTAAGGISKQEPNAHEDSERVPDSEIESERRRTLAVGEPSESEGGSEEVHFGTQKPVAKRGAGSRLSEVESEGGSESEAESEGGSESEAQETVGERPAPARSGRTSELFEALRSCLQVSSVLRL